MSDPAENSTTQDQPESTPAGTAGKPAQGTGGRQPGGIRFTIGWKITSLVVVVMTVLAVVNIIFIQSRYNTTMNREFESKAQAIAFSIASSSEDKLLSGNVEVIQSLVDNFRDIHGIRYVYVQDSTGVVVAHTFDGIFPKSILGLNPVTGEESHRILKFQRDEVGDILEVAVPILFGVAGTARVGMDHGLITSELDSITWRLIVQFAVAQILGIVLLHLMVIYLLRHIRTVLATLKRVGEGDLTARVEVPTRDEFLDLAQSLNSTLAKLAGMIDRVDHSYEGISRANVRISQVYNDVQEGIEQQAGLASETMESVVSNKKMIDDVTEGIHILENSSNDSFSSVMEMGASIEEVSSMADALFKSVNESNTAIENLSASIDEINRNLLTLSKGADETSSAMNEMSASIVQVRGNAESTSQDAVQMTKVAEEGATISRNAMGGMEAIKKSSGQVTQMISLVSDRIEEIDEILRFITEITGKTNLLALNAAIIAAQAGAQGKGFGVVADEINELAQNTKAQTNRIAQVIEGLREEVSRTSEAVIESNLKVDEGVALSGKVTTALEGIMESTMLVSHRVEEIAQTTSEQASTSNRVLEATQHLTDSVGNIKGISEQQTQAGEKLLQMSKQIQQAAQKVKDSTEEQTFTSQQINKDLTRISDTVRTISESTEIQVVNGSKVLKMTEDLGGVIQKNKTAVHGLKGIIDDLNERMQALHAELEIFVTEEDIS
ncbi:MAG: methyl-accepting chemotaxis protein [bacterium]|nr:methyl-accepting chemotaxis protein [bacterium]